MRTGLSARSRARRVRSRRARPPWLLSRGRCHLTNRRQARGLDSGLVECRGILPEIAVYKQVCVPVYFREVVRIHAVGSTDNEIAYERYEPLLVRVEFLLVLGVVLR